MTRERYVRENSVHVSWISHKPRALRRFSATEPAPQQATERAVSPSRSRSYVEGDLDELACVGSTVCSELRLAVGDVGLPAPVEPDGRFARAVADA